MEAIKAIVRRNYLNAVGRICQPSRGTHFLNGHYVSRDEIAIELQREIFYDRLIALSKHCDLVSPNIALDQRFQRTQKLVCLTFDDGFQDVYTTLVPVLKEVKVSAIFFINPSFIGLGKSETAKVLRDNYGTTVAKQFLTKQELISVIKEGHLIGSHSLTHRRLTGINQSAFEEEILKSKSVLQTEYNVDCKCFAYPFGGKNDISPEALSLASAAYPFVFSSITSDGLFSFGGKVINRRHFEGNWPVAHVRYFLSSRR